MIVVERRNVKQGRKDLVRYVGQMGDVRMVEVHLMVQVTGRTVILRVGQMRAEQMVRQLLLKMHRKVVLLLQHKVLLVAAEW